MFLEIILHYFMSMSNLIWININIMEMKMHMLIDIYIYFHIHVDNMKNEWNNYKN